MGGVVEDGLGLGVTRGSADDRRDEGAENAGVVVTETRAAAGLARGELLVSDPDAAPPGGEVGLDRTLASAATSGDAAADPGRRRGANLGVGVELDRTRARPLDAAPASAAASLDELDLDRTRASMSSSRGHAGVAGGSSADLLAAATLASASSSGMGPSELADTTAQVERAPTLDLRRGAATLGRYVLLEELGAGGMGVVYTAFDPELDRKIALKVVQAAAGIPAAAVGGLSWLMREAQAM
ncbi:MAG: hypothetical protein KC486_33255, partial [Myxococcales bacterium]|nr:hypothetical protein [Myxococcales bacterium]